MLDPSPPHRLAPLRAALVRAHLAASELAREASTPRTAALVDRILAATRELETLLDEAPTGDGSPASGGPEGAGARAVDPALALRAMHARLARALLRAGVRWTEPAAVAAAPVDAALLRRIASELLRAGARRAARGGLLRLEVEPAAGAAALRLEVESAPVDAAEAREADRDWQRACQWLAAIRASLGIEIEEETGEGVHGGAVRVRVRLPAHAPPVDGVADTAPDPQEEAACNGS